MKQKIHPQYFSQAKAKCACGAQYSVGSTKQNLEVEVCAQCHPFYTGKDKVVDKAGRVEKYRARLAKAQKKRSAKKKSKKPQKMGKHIR